MKRRTDIVRLAIMATTGVALVSMGTSATGNPLSGRLKRAAGISRAKPSWHGKSSARGPRNLRALEPGFTPQKWKDCNRYIGQAKTDCREYLNAKGYAAKGHYETALGKLKGLSDAAKKMKYVVTLRAKVDKGQKEAAEKKRKEDEAETTLARIKDDGLTSDSHRSNVGKIIFSAAEVVFAKEDAAQLRGSFKLKSPIYGRAYLSASLCNQKMDEGWKLPKYGYRCAAMIHLMVNGKKVDQWRLDPKPRKGRTATTFQLVPKPDVNDSYQYGEGPMRLHVALSLAGTGTHQVEYVYFLEHDVKDENGRFSQTYGEKPVARGGFSVKVEKRTLKAMAKRYWAPFKAKTLGDKKMVRRFVRTWNNTYSRQYGKL